MTEGHDYALILQKQGALDVENGFFGGFGLDDIGGSEVFVLQP